MNIITDIRKYSCIMVSAVLAALASGCTEAVEYTAGDRAVRFAISGTWNGNWSRSETGGIPVFGSGDRIGVFACYRPKSGAGTSDFTSNFMRNQAVAFDGSIWSYSPVKYWPADGSVEFRGYFPYSDSHNNSDDGSLTFDHECKTGLEPLYAAHTTVTADNGTLSGDGIGENGSLRLAFTPLLNKVNFTAKAAGGLFEEDASDEYRDYRFLITGFRIYGFYSKASYNTTAKTWTGHDVQYTAENPLDMSQHMDLKDTETAVPGYKYDPDAGYRTGRAVVVAKNADAINIFGKSAYLIPMDGIISGNEPGFEIQYIVLTEEPGGNTYKESATVTRSGSLRDIFADHSGLIEKVINVNLTFTVDGVTVTRELTDYKYKPMF